MRWLTWNPRDNTERDDLYHVQKNVFPLSDPFEESFSFCIIISLEFFFWNNYQYYKSDIDK